MDKATYEKARKFAYDQHKAAYDAARAKAGQPLIVTRDMCWCGMTTGAFKTEACKNLRALRDL